MSGDPAPEIPFSAIKDTLKKAAGALRKADIPFALGGGLAIWARGGADTDHDLDLMVTEADAERALDALEGEGMQAVRPPEDWLYKAYDGDVLIDVIFRPTGVPITDEVLERAEEREVNAVRMKVLPVEDVLVTKLLAMGEHELDYDPVLEIARTLREQIDWEQVRNRTAGSPYAKAFFTLVQELGVLSPPDRSA